MVRNPVLCIAEQSPTKIISIHTIITPHACLRIEKATSPPSATKLHKIKYEKLSEPKLLFQQNLPYFIKIIMV